jgi:predicted nucleic acid-binding protein
LSLFVLDNSIRANAVVPSIWRLEIVNTLVVAERRKKLLPAASAAFLRDLDGLNIEVDADGLRYAFTAVVDIARKYQRSAYDASYLELAVRRGLPLATRDEPLRKAALELGLLVFDPLRLNS